MSDLSFPSQTEGKLTSGLEAVICVTLTPPLAERNKDSVNLLGQ
jgi:hypothetical protein